MERGLSNGPAPDNWGMAQLLDDSDEDAADGDEPAPSAVRSLAVAPAVVVRHLNCAICRESSEETPWFEVDVISQAPVVPMSDVGASSEVLQPVGAVCEDCGKAAESYCTTMTQEQVVEACKSKEFRVAFMFIVQVLKGNEKRTWRPRFCASLETVSDRTIAEYALVFAGDFDRYFGMPMHSVAELKNVIAPRKDEEGVVRDSILLDIASVPDDLPFRRYELFSETRNLLQEFTLEAAEILRDGQARETFDWSMAQMFKSGFGSGCRAADFHKKVQFSFVKGAVEVVQKDREQQEKVMEASLRGDDVAAAACVVRRSAGRLQAPAACSAFQTAVSAAKAASKASARSAFAKASVAPKPASSGPGAAAFGVGVASSRSRGALGGGSRLSQSPAPAPLPSSQMSGVVVSASETASVDLDGPAKKKRRRFSTAMDYGIDVNEILSTGKADLRTITPAPHINQIHPAQLNKLE